MKLEGCVAVVIGGARGIGRAYCVSLLQRNVKVCCGDVLEEVGRQTEQELQKEFGLDNFVFQSCNGRSETQITDILFFTKHKFGRLDIVVNNVGIMDEGNWQTCLETNLGTTIRVTTAVLNLLGKDKGGNGGVLVHTSSSGGLEPEFCCPVYCGTKAGLIAYVRAWTHKINYEQHGVRMFTVCPKVTETAFIEASVKPSRVVNVDILRRILDKTSDSFVKPEWVGEALIKGLEDDEVNGAAIQVPSREFKFHFMGPNTAVAAAQRVT